MATSITLANMRTLVASLSGITIGSEERFTASIVNTMIRESFAQYWLALAEFGHPQRITRTTLTTSSVTTASNGWPTNQRVALPSDFLSLLSAQIEDTSGAHIRLTQFSGIDVSNNEFPFDAVAAGTPRQVRVAEGTDGAKVLRLKPPADGTYTITITYVQSPPALGDADDAVEMDFFPGTMDMVSMDVCLKMHEMDAEFGQQSQAWTARRDRAEAVLRRYAATQFKGGPAVWNSVK